MSNHLNGFNYFLRGFQLITQPRIRLFVAIPLFINTVLFAGIIYYGWLKFQTLLAWVEELLPNWLTWLSWLLIPLFVLTAIMVVFFAFSWLANLIGGPFNSLLAEAVERTLTGKPVESPPSTVPWYRTLLATGWWEVKRLLYYLIWFIILTMISFIPGINLISPILWFIFGAWLLCLEYADAPLGNHGYNPKMQRKLLASKPLLSLEFGSMALLVMMIPVLNFLAMPVGVAGITCMWVNELKDV